MNIQINMNLKHLLVLMAFIGIIAVASAATSVLRDTTSEVQGLNVTTINISNNGGSTGLNQVKVGSFTYDTSTASGTQAITGVGFKPTHVDFYAVVGTSPEVSIGTDTGTSAGAVFNYHNVTANTWGSHTSQSIVFWQGSGTAVSGYITATGNDGFTLTWTKTGSKVGTATIVYTAHR